MTPPRATLLLVLCFWLPGVLVGQQVVHEGIVTLVWADPIQGPPPPPTYYLHTSDADYRLEWAEGRPPHGLRVVPGTRWRVTGMGAAPALRADGGRGQGLIRVLSTRDAGSPAALQQDVGTLRYLTLTCQAPGGPPLNYTPSAAAARWGKQYPAVGHFLDDLSEGQMDFQSVGGVGPAQMPNSPSFYGNYPNVNTGAIAQDCVDGIPDLSLDGIDGINLVTNLSPGAAFGGTSFVTVGGVGRSIATTWIPHNQSGFGVIIHEVGHSIGWSHSGTDYDGDQGEPYSSHWDVMSAADWGSEQQTDFGQQIVPRQTIAANRMASGWVPTERHVVITPGSSSEQVLEIAGSGRLGPRAPGVRDLIEIVTPTGARYTLETRFKRGAYDISAVRGGVVMHRLTRPIALGLGCCLAKLVDADGNGNAIDEGVTWNPGEVFSGGTTGFGFEILDSLPNGYRVRVRSGFETRAIVQGQGRILGMPGGHCLAECTDLAATAEAPLVLTAQPTDADMPFRRWLGDCSGTGDCLVPRNRDATVRAWFGRDAAFIVDSLRPHATTNVVFNDVLAVDVLGSPQFAVVAGSLPPGITLNGTTGQLSGTPTNPGTYRFTASVTAAGASAERGFVMRVHAPLAIGPGDSVGVVRGEVTELPIAVGTGGPVALELVSGSWPQGLSPNSYGALVGVPTGTGTVTATFDQVRGPETIRRTFHFRMVNGVVAIRNTPVGNAFVGFLIDRQLSTETSEEATWRLASGELPPGLTLSTTGHLTGRTATPGEFRFTVEARIASLTATREFAMIVAVPALERTEVMSALLRGTALDNVQRQYLDFIGNGNSRFDLADVRAWLRSTGAIPGAGGAP